VGRSAGYGQCGGIAGASGGLSAYGGCVGRNAPPEGRVGSSGRARERARVEARHVSHRRHCVRRGMATVAICTGPLRGSELAFGFTVIVYTGFGCSELAT
jgi:hypothetical protein